LKNEENRKTLYGQSYAPMAGGVTNVIKTVTQQDIDAAVKQAKTEIIVFAKEELKKHLVQQNAERNTHVELLVHAKTITMGDPVVTMESAIIGVAKDSGKELFRVCYQISGSASASCFSRGLGTAFPIARKRALVRAPSHT
jgi:hypothetical protein